MRKIFIYPILLLFIGVTVSQTIEARLPELSISNSKYVQFVNPQLLNTGGQLAFSGDFLLLGEGFFGHFDFALYADSGNVIKVVTSQDRAYQRDNGAKVKSIQFALGKFEKCSKIVVSFHEMRLEPDGGLCNTGGK